MSEKKIVPGTGGDRYVPYEERTGNESIVYLTRDLSAEGLQKIYQRVSADIRPPTTAWEESLLKQMSLVR